MEKKFQKNLKLIILKIKNMKLKYVKLKSNFLFLKLIIKNNL